MIYTTFYAIVLQDVFFILGWVVAVFAVAIEQRSLQQRSREIKELHMPSAVVVPTRLPHRLLLLPSILLLLLFVVALEAYVVLALGIEGTWPQQSKSCAGCVFGRLLVADERMLNVCTAESFDMCGRVLKKRFFFERVAYI